MKAWNIVLNKIPDAELLVFGKGPVEKVKKELHANNTDKVVFYGHISRAELYQHLAESSIAIFPSFAENFAIGPMEAMACGTATIYTERTSGPELITHGEHGLLIDPDNVQSIADSIISLLENDNLRATLAENGKNRIFTQFDVRVIGKKHTDFYTKVLSGAG
jgi:glycosyltransferase involved in cell wall biosynthesis